MGRVGRAESSRNEHCDAYHAGGAGAGSGAADCVLVRLRRLRRFSGFEQPCRRFWTTGFSDQHPGPVPAVAPKSGIPAYLALFVSPARSAGWSVCFTRFDWPALGILRAVFFAPAVPPLFGAGTPTVSRLLERDQWRDPETSAASPAAADRIVGAAAAADPGTALR